MKNANKNKMALCALSLAIVTSLSATAQDSAVNDDEADSEDTYSNRMLIVGQKQQLNTEAGSVTLIDEAQLEKFEFDDIHRILSQVPGINIRQEDGYGLRPNIGFRGVTPERSKKINILEDGILIGPAPYSAPAAYYFPTTSRLTAIEVFKGPTAILNGPNTVAGTINLQTRQVTEIDEGMLDVAVGSENYQKFHGYVIENFGNLGVLIEGLHTESDGFKELDGGGDTGFDKNDLTAKFRYNLEGERFNQVFELKLGYADEVSDETYLGLTDADFAANPYRRYAASQLGRMDWEHTQFQFNHFISGKDFDVTTRVYRNNFDRAWRKLNNFASSGNAAPSLQRILQFPDDVNFADFYRVLTGERDSQASFEELLIGTNDRSFYSQGIQSDLRWQVEWGGFSHNIKAGVRYHEDEIVRLHTEERFSMTNSQLVLIDNTLSTTTANTEYSEVWSIHAQDTLDFDNWELTFGIRGEQIDSYYQNNLVGREEDWLRKSTTVWLPAVSAFYSLSEDSGIFAGVHRGFIPTSPQQRPEIEIEESVNLELGYRYYQQTRQIELVGFFTDFKNLKESCTASTSSVCISNIDQEFNAGEVDVAGLEATYSDTFTLTGSIDMPISIVYTFTDAEFKEDFRSDFELWGDVTGGDPVPYLPENSFTIDIGLANNQWRTNLLLRYTDELHEAAGDGVALSGVTTDEIFIADFSAAYDFDDLGTVYLKIDNLMDEENIVSRRPFGARPGKPRQFYLGYKYRW